MHENRYKKNRQTLSEPTSLAGGVFDEEGTLQRQSLLIQKTQGFLFFHSKVQILTKSSTLLNTINRCPMTAANGLALEAYFERLALS